MESESSSPEGFGQSPELDIQHAVQQAQNPDSAEDTDYSDRKAGEVLTVSEHCPLLGLRYALAKCGLLAEKCPWQTTMAIMLTVAAGWVCTYFGISLLLGLFLWALSLEE